ncbi:MAG: hypothetical protein RL748_2539 [Pseudomonadota bacterium]
MSKLWKKRCTHWLLFGVSVIAILQFARAGESDQSAPAHSAASAAPVELLGSAGRAATTALAVDEQKYSSQTFDWVDSSRQREVPVRLYLPAGQHSSAKLPLIIFSHGIGGSRNGYTYLGRFFAANGYASLHVQHVGSDRQIWRGNPLTMWWRVSGAAKASEAIERAHDVSFALDQLLKSDLAGQIDAQRIIAAGHSYGANTTMLIAGAAAESDGKPVALRDERIKAAILISAPPFYGAKDSRKILAPLTIPSLHITSTGDDIEIPGYRSGLSDRLDIYRATAAAAEKPKKALVVFKDGSHSMFTDRRASGGVNLNPQVKLATRSLVLAFLRDLEHPEARAMQSWQQQNQGLLSALEQTSLN